MSPEVIQRRLEVLEEALAALRALQQTEKNEFLTNFEKFGATERFLQVAIEIVNDLGNHLIADQRLGTPYCMRDVPQLLSKAGLIGHDLGDEWSQMVGFRNILVHEYVKLNRLIVFEVLRNHLDIFDKLAKFFAEQSL
jgi:uncharacterized protein YutE (UPF0331/DUF86 family)